MDDDVVDAVRQIFDADEPVVIRVRHELEPFQRRLLVALGAGYVIDAVHGDRCALQCGHEECHVSAAAVNRDVRVEAGENGTVVVMSAYCTKCKSVAMPRDDGSCSWCGSVIVDEDKLPIKAMLAQIEERRPVDGLALLERMDAGEPVAPDEPEEELEEASAAGAGAGAGVSSSPGLGSPSGPVEPAPLVSEETSSHAGDGATNPYGLTKRGRGYAWTRHVAIQAARDFAAEHGCSPSSNSLKTLPAGALPNHSAAKRLFGGWPELLAAADLAPSTSGPKRPHGSGREPQAEVAAGVGPEPERTVSPPAADTAEAASRPENDRGHAVAWTPEEILDAIRRWAHEHGQPPTSNGWTPRVDGYPSTTTVAKHFGSWAAGIEAAGFPRPTRGHTPNPGSQQPPARVRVNGTGLSYRSAEEAYVAADEIEADGERVADHARFDGNEAKAEKARDQSRELAEKIRAAAHTFEGRAGHAVPACERPAEPLPEPTADSDLNQEVIESPEPHLLVKPDEMPPGQRAFARSLIAGLRAFADTLERETEDPA